MSSKTAAPSAAKPVPRRACRARCERAGTSPWPLPAPADPSGGDRSEPRRQRPARRFFAAFLIGSAFAASDAVRAEQAPSPAPSSSASSSTPSSEKASGDPVGPGEACDRAIALPKEIEAVTPDRSILDGVTEGRNAALEAAATVCAAAEPAEAGASYRLGLAFKALKRKDAALAAFRRAKERNYPGGYDAIAEGRFDGLYGPALPKDPSAGLAVLSEGVARTGHPELKRYLARNLASAEPPLRDSARALTLLEQAARAGHAPAKADWARRIAEEADGQPAPDEARIRALLEEAVASGSRHAAFVYGQLHDRGIGLKRDLAAARRFYLLGAERDSIAAMLELAGMMRDGEGGPVDIAGQRRWLLRASGLGNATATFALANSHIDNAPTNVTLGLVLLERLAEGGSIEAAHGLGVRYQDAGGVVRDYALAMKWFRRAAEAGDGRAMHQIGTIYDYGQGVPVDHAEARRWYDRAAAKGVAAAYTAIGMQYDHARGVPRDLAEALAWYRKGAERGSAASMNNIGYAYMAGRGVTRDDGQAVRWLEQAVAKNDRTAKLNLANLHFKGRGVKKDPIRGLTLLQEAAEQGLPQALNDLALMEMERPQPNGARAVRMLRQAAVDGAAVAYHNLSMALIQGWDGVPDDAEANYWFRQSIDNRSDIDAAAYSESQFQLGRNLVAGRGIARDVEGGLALIRASAAARNPRAMSFLRTAGQARAAKSKGGSSASVRKAGAAKGKKAPAARRAQR
ncbi:hypothetical protein GPNCGGLF_LOCUS2663 [Methylorubrum aminovorans]